MDKLIETALPLSRINARTISERTIAGHPANMHMWWGRSPHYSSIVSLTAALVDSPESQEEIRNRSERLLEANYTEFGDKPTVFDPFSGFGGIPLTAQMLGLPAIAADLNPSASCPLLQHAPFEGAIAVASVNAFGLTDAQVKRVEATIDSIHIIHMQDHLQIIIPERDYAATIRRIHEILLCPDEA